MAIDKTIPNKLQTDMDQRGVNPRAGEMLDAQNVTMSESGRNSAGVIKNVRGTVAATAATVPDSILSGDPVTVIGSVSDPQRGYIYWFVSDDSGQDRDGVYQYNASNTTEAGFDVGEYREVLRGSFFNFDSNSFVKASVVNSELQQDGNIQTVIYFTDNINPPRKLNVDRALTGEFSGSGLSPQSDYSLNVVKAAPTRVPIVGFRTDEDIFINNFSRSAFQIAYQFIYTDGEESAISGYSKLAFPDSSTVVGLESSASSKLYYEDNVCEIDLRTSYGGSTEAIFDRIYIEDVRSIRILARQGNDGSFFVVDEVDIDSNKTKTVYGSDVQVYNRTNGKYLWYNDGNGSSIPSFDQNKLYDNVPLQAAGMALAGNRLMMSNYTEGRPNHDVDALIQVVYNDIRDGGSNSSAGSAISWNNAVPSNGGKIEIDFLQVFSAASDTIPSNSRTFITFEWDGIGSVTSNNGADNIFELDATDTSNYQTYQFGMTSLELANSANLVFSMVINNQEDITVGALPALIAEQIEGITLEKQYVTTNAGGLLSLTRTDETAPTMGFDTDDYNALVTFSFDDYTITNTPGNSKIEIRPYISDIQFNGLTGYPFGQQITADNVIYNIGQGGIPFTSDDQADLSYTFDTGLVTSAAVTSTAFTTDKSWKAGATHELGVVYYDKYNRSGNVNKIGSFYVDHFSERSESTGKGSCSVSVEISNNAPDWAERYQFVYPGNSTYSSWVTHTTGGGFYELEDYTTSNPTNPNENKKQIYVSLNTLEAAKDSKGSLVDYSFTKGDKLRVISYDQQTYNTQNPPSIVYPSASDGSPIEFNVVGVKTLSAGADNPLHGTHAVNEDLDPHLGTFLILDAPQVNGGVQDVDGNIIKYEGFDWFSISASTYPGEASATTLKNHWHKRCVVEILTPRVNSSETVWYEIGEDYPVGLPKDISGQTAPSSNHGRARVLNGAEVFFRPASQPTPYRDGSGWTKDDKTDYRNENVTIESQRASDFFGDKSWDKGRPHVVFEDSATIRRLNGITYSDAYAEDVANLSLSSFNASLANFFSLESSNGACNYIEKMRDGYMIAVQENSVSRIPVGKDIITSANQSGLVSLTTNVLGEPFYYIGDYGCGNNPESVLVRDGSVFFVDASRKKVVRLTGEGLSPASENGIDSLFKNEYDTFAAQGGTRMVSGFDPEDGVYYITLRPSGTYNGLTLGYNISGGMWQSRYSFVPDMYSDQNGTMYSALYVDPEDADAILFHSHTNETARNTFYGTSYPAVVRTVSNYNPSLPKVFNAISLEGDSASWVADPVDTSLGGSGQSKAFVEKEGSYYSEFTRDENGTKHMMGIGAAASVDGTALTITFNNRVNRNPIPYGAAVRRFGDSVGIGSFGRDFRFQRFVDAYTIEGYFEEENTVINANITFEDQSMMAISNASVDGDPLRGHWADITLTNNQTAPFELFCINTHFSPSDQNHSLGQQ